MTINAQIGTSFPPKSKTVDIQVQEKFLSQTSSAILAFLTDGTQACYYYSNNNHDDKSPFYYDVLEVNQNNLKHYIPVPVFASVLGISLPYDAEMRHDASARSSFLKESLEPEFGDKIVATVTKRKIR